MVLRSFFHIVFILEWVKALSIEGCGFLVLFDILSPVTNISLDLASFFLRMRIGSSAVFTKICFQYLFCWAVEKI